MNFLSDISNSFIFLFGTTIFIVLPLTVADVPSTPPDVIDTVLAEYCPSCNCFSTFKVNESINLLYPVGAFVSFTVIVSGLFTSAIFTVPKSIIPLSFVVLVSADVFPGIVTWNSAPDNF